MTINNLKQRLLKVFKEKRKSEINGHYVYKKILPYLFTCNQGEYLLKKETKGSKSKQKEFSYSNTGYHQLLWQGFPLPCRRTLIRRISHIKFKSGISDEIFDFFEQKVTDFTDEINRPFSLALDELSIEGGAMFDPQTK